MRARRCDKHKDQVRQPIEDGGGWESCLKCRLEELQEKNLQLEKILRRSQGDLVLVKIGYPINRVFAPILHALGYRSQSVWSDDVIKIGNVSSSDGWACQIPAGMAQAFEDAWQEVADTLLNLYANEATLLRSRFERIIEEKLIEGFRKRAISLQVDLRKVQLQVVQKASEGYQGTLKPKAKGKKK